MFSRMHLLCAALVATVVVAATATAQQDTFTGIVNSDAVHVRSGASTNH